VVGQQSKLLRMMINGGDTRTTKQLAFDAELLGNTKHPQRQPRLTLLQLFRAQSSLLDTQNVRPFVTSLLCSESNLLPKRAYSFRESLLNVFQNCAESCPS
jgi:hypothetical protein